MDNDGFGFEDRADAQVIRVDGSYRGPGIEVNLSQLAESFFVGGTFVVECFDPAGDLKWAAEAPNMIVNGALDDILNTYFRNGTTQAAWFMGLVDNAGFTAFAAADTIAAHTGWSESTAFTESVRQTWSPAASSGQSISNGTAATFSMNTNSTTIRGLFVATNSTKGGTTGMLLSTAAFSGGNQAVNSGDSLKCTYSISASSS